MIEDLGIAAPANVGYYSGMVDSSFSFAQLFTASIRPIITVFLSRIETSHLITRAKLTDLFLDIAFGPDRSQTGHYDRSHRSRTRLY